MVEKSHHPYWWPDLYQPLKTVGERMADLIAPRSEAKAAKAAYQIAVELPGVAKENVELSLHEGVLSVKGEKRSEKSEEGEGYFFSEREYGKFQRTFRLPADASEDGIEATFTDGVLRISVPKKAPESPKARKIEVSSG